jgi:hypothetical protein
MNFKDTIPVDPAAELSLDNILTDIRFRGELGFKLVDYTFTNANATVVLEFGSCVVAPDKTKGK